jgi:hypothetical protein
MTKKTPLTIIVCLTLCSAISACTSGPLKINQSGKSAEVIEVSPKQALPKAQFSVVIIPSGAITTSVISDKASSAGGILGSMVVGPIAGLAGSFAGSTAGSHAASQAEASATIKEDRQDVVQAVRAANLPIYFSTRLADQLNNCGIKAELYPQALDTEKANWFESNLNLPADFPQQAVPYRFFLQAGMTSIQVKNGLTDNTLEGSAYVRVYETRRLKQIGRYSDSTGKTGSVTLNKFTASEPERIQELSQAAKGAAQYLASGIGTDICSIMRKF